MEGDSLDLGYDPSLEPTPSSEIDGANPRRAPARRIRDRGGLAHDRPGHRHRAGPGGARRKPVRGPALPRGRDLHRPRQPDLDRVRGRRPGVRRREARHRQGLRQRSTTRPRRPWSTCGTRSWTSGTAGCWGWCSTRSSSPRDRRPARTCTCTTSSGLLPESRRRCGVTGARTPRPARAPPRTAAWRRRSSCASRSTRRPTSSCPGPGWSCSTTGAPSSRATAAAG